MVFLLRIKVLLSFSFSLDFDKISNIRHILDYRQCEGKQENIFKGGLNETYFRHCDMQFWCGVAGRL